ncbi:flagellar hook-associated protein FlgL [Effusibacillus dendaii]|uniref:Flagellar hook-associated protein FlgL n=1 Tax=Effusibacillus dendaii TaxID=2743772 RepID=A0A7I8DCP6_9BACL|nr:flagellar hook-associated protein FlgL [Effusibacillus dendaii]BCJ87865.1 flagellar hook-associated protein FlgL [Effusibacillus dendaii]
MRVTQSMLNSQFVKNVQINNKNLDIYQRMLETGKKLNKPEDDPVGVGFAMRYEEGLSRIQQYQRNLSSLKSDLETYDTYISKVNDLLQRVRQLAVQGASDTVPQDARQAMAKEVDQIYKEMVDLGNSQFNGKYMFNGQKTDQIPYSNLANAETQNSDTNRTMITISDNTYLPGNITGQAVFGTAGASDNAFMLLKNLSNALNTNNTTAISQAIGFVDIRMSAVHAAWSEVGVLMNRVDLVDNRLRDQQLNVTKVLSDTMDTDIPKTITDLKMAETVQRASLSVGSRILQPSLVDFLR